jgi:hypothetical protein
MTSLNDGELERDEAPVMGSGLAPLSEVPDLSDYDDDDERIEAIQNWFLENFEDPANETPYDGGEGGYQYIWGGPFDLWEEMGEAFGDQVEPEVIDKAAEGLSDRAHEWAPAGHRIIQPDEEDRDPVPPLPARLEALGGQLDIVEQGVDHLLKLDVDEEEPQHGMGHNNPPPETPVPGNWFDPEDPPLTRNDLLAIKESIAELRAELAKPDAATNADVEVVTRAEGLFSRFRRFMLKLGSAGAFGIVGGIGKHVGDGFAAAHPELITAAVNAANTITHWMVSLL